MKGGVALNQPFQCSGDLWRCSALEMSNVGAVGVHLGRGGNDTDWLAYACFGCRDIFSQRTRCPRGNLLTFRILNVGIVKNSDKNITCKNSGA